MASSDSTTWPPAAGLCSPTVPRQDAVFQSSGSCRINAPAALVFENVLRIQDYEKWNSFVPEARIVKQQFSRPDLSPDEQAAEASDFSHMKKDCIMHFSAVMNSAKPENKNQIELLVTDISTPDKPSDYLDAETLTDPAYTSDLSKLYRISWKSHGGFVTKGLRTERFHEIIVLGENECEVRTWEVYGAVLAYTVKWMYQKTLNEKFQLWADDLKKYSEQQAMASKHA
ncbi:hypothetical protein CLAFUW4_10576 [Fulvia fulva]|uniref:Coenzyme Q-binding protein COQ10 START domain-containing protein n=1 Tax=Passalora fulva TaxID=5499 RepID=A0A9Q8LGF0_PASFU|nr:uncharacterized protein CLAFUR5_05191 [Fulvia fulva]KAK4615469.1 hypothetical protein CLAFUR4_10581 [Fulvia fulva]KAK4617250.1 hypothetical protein CLAFUR0_10663 [Fulvia fulva]UJO16932.1 hypothetical protein CLAFUR5_05191 [Fulvia fulva]WPV19762.1 hypothetical protein CLAFUW4_10576 [Fulvia fulva]WPV34531.1 hypothetical protein CLAFUW7_10578 [Fulvia fulva]